MVPLPLQRRKVSGRDPFDDLADGLTVQRLGIDRIMDADPLDQGIERARGQRIEEPLSAARLLFIQRCITRDTGGCRAAKA